jgi:hypothetical protein
VSGLQSDPALHPPPAPAAGDGFRRHVTYTRLEIASIIHSVIFIGLLVAAFLAGKPQPWTFILGFTHGVLFVVMAVLCIVAARYRMLPSEVVVAVIVFGGIGPFLGSVWFIRYADQQRAAEAGRATH